MYRQVHVFYGLDIFHLLQHFDSKFLRLHCKLMQLFHDHHDNNYQIILQENSSFDFGQPEIIHSNSDWNVFDRFFHFFNIWAPLFGY